MAQNRRRKKTDVAILIKAGAFLLVIVLAILLMNSIMKMGESPVDDVSENSSESSSQSTGENSDPFDVSFGEPVSSPEEIEFTPITVNNDNMYTGDLLLVNADHPYTFPDSEKETLVNVYYNKSGDYKLSTVELLLQPQVVDAMNTMMADYKKLYGKTDLTIMTGYRTMEQQQKVYEQKVASVGAEKAETLVSKPGESDLHTGLSMNWMIVTSSNVYSFDPTGDYAWVAENAFRYGFIQRYRAGKEQITGKEAMDGYYRYVGLPHSYIMNVSNQSLEEYIAFVKNYRYDGDMLTQEIDGTSYKIYYYPADAGTSTVIPVPSDCTEYHISGNNFDGFIVTAVYK